MSNLVLATCPFCQCCVFLNLGKSMQSELASRDGSSLDLAAQTDQQLVGFNSGQSTELPCEHLVLLHGNCYVMPEAQKSSKPLWWVDYFWNHPQLPSGASGGLDSVWLLFDGQQSGVTEFRPTVPFDRGEFDETIAVTFAHPRLKLSAGGFVLFAADVSKFLAEAIEFSTQLSTGD